MTTYYLDANAGSDANAGTSAGAAWQTLAKVNSFPFAVGDSLLLHGGQTVSGTLVWTTSGTAAGRCLVSSYGGGQATIACGDGDGVTLLNCEYVTLTGITVTGSGVSPSGVTTSTGIGINVHSTVSTGVKWRSVWVQNCTVSGCHDGIVLHTPVSSGPVVGYQDARVESCTVHDCLFGGIWCWGGASDSGAPYHFPLGFGTFTTLHIADCHVYNIYGAPTSGIALCCFPITPNNVQFGLIERNVIHDCGAATSSSLPAGGMGSLVFTECDSCVAQYNEIYNSHSNVDHDGCAFDIDGDCTNCILQYNYSHDNAGAGYQTGTYSGTNSNNNNVIRYNVSRNDCRTVTSTTSQGALCAFGGTGVQVYHNTVYSNRSGAAAAIALAMVTAGQAAFYNNILVAANGMPLVQIVGGSPTFQGNLYWASGGAVNIGGYASLAAFRAGADQENRFGSPVGVFADPLLANLGIPDSGTLPGAPVATITAFDPGAGSPAIDAGRNLLTEHGVDVGPLDLHGNPSLFGAARDIGAVEVGSTQPLSWIFA